MRALRRAAPDMPPVSNRRLWLGVSALLCSGVAAAAALPRSAETSDADAVQWEALAIAPLARGGDTGLRMSARRTVEPIAVAPQRKQLDFNLTAGGEPVGMMLMRAGASYGDAALAGAMIGALPAGTTVHLVLGEPSGSGRAIARVEVTPRMDVRLRLFRDSNGALQLDREQLAVDTTPVRIRGLAGDGLYWALRAAGASPQSTADYLRALATEIDVGADVGPNDAFDLVIASRKSASGERAYGALLYAGIDRTGVAPIQLVRWGDNNRVQWISAASLDRPAEHAVGMTWPANGRITSTFGWRRHPILGFGRMHKGVDFGASWGSPIVAAASGQVTMSGWAGGYGRQVRISHGGGIASSYSHMSSIVAEPGSFVRQGQVIGYVGSSGLSTGAHLHYEVYQSGQAVDPLGVRFASAAPVADGQAKAIKARLAALLKVGMKRG